MEKSCARCYELVAWGIRPVLPPARAAPGSRLSNTPRRFGSLQALVLTGDVSSAQKELFTRGSVLNQLREDARGSGEPLLIVPCSAGTRGRGLF